MTIFTWTGIKITGYNLTIFKQKRTFNAKRYLQYLELQQNCKWSRLRTAVLL